MIRPLEFQIGPRRGLWARIILEGVTNGISNIRAHGIDISPAAIEIAHKRMPDGQFYVVDITETFLDDVCDLVVCSEVLEHIPDDLLALQNLKKMTGKYLLVSTPQGKMRGI